MRFEIDRGEWFYILFTTFASHSFHILFLTDQMKVFVSIIQLSGRKIRRIFVVFQRDLTTRDNQFLRLPILHKQHVCLPILHNLEVHKPRMRKTYLNLYLTEPLRRNVETRCRIIEPLRRNIMPRCVGRLNLFGGILSSIVG